MSAGELLAHAERRRDEVSTGDDAARARAARELEFAGVYADHERLLDERGALDSGDLVLRACALLGKRPDVRGRVSGRVDHLLVDDLQDANFAQASLVGLLREESRQVTATGNEDAALHRLRGAGAEEPRRLRARVRGRHDRRAGGVASASASASTASPTRSWPRSRGGAGRPYRRREGGEVRFWRCASERAQAQAVAAEVERLIAGGAAPERIGVIVDSVPEEGPVVGSALEERAVRFRLQGASALFAQPEVRDVLAWLRVLADPGRLGCGGARPVASAGGAALRGHRAPHPARPAAQAGHARRGGGGAGGPAAHAGGSRPRPPLPAPLPGGRQGVRGPAARPLRAAPDRAHRHPPPAGVRHAGRHGRAPAQRGAPAGAGHRVRAARDRRHPARLHRLPARRGRLGPARGGARAARHDPRRPRARRHRRRRRGARPRLRDRPRRRAHARARPRGRRRGRARGAAEGAPEPRGRPRGGPAAAAVRGGHPRARERGALVGPGPRRDAAAPVALPGGGPRGAGRGRGDRRGGAVRTRRGPALGLPRDARRPARHGLGGRRAGSGRCAWTRPSTSPRRWLATSS